MVAKRGILFFLIWLLCVGLCAVGLYSTGLKKFENQSWDWRLKLSARKEDADKRIKIIVVDQKSLNSRTAEGITWPWPREMYVPVIQFLNKAGAKAVAFDMLFTESSSWGVADDKRFAEAIQSSRIPVIVGLNPTLHEENGSIAELVAEVRKHQDEQKELQNAYATYLYTVPVTHYGSVLAPVSELIQAGAYIGGVKGDPDTDGIFRHTRPGFIAGNIPILSLPFTLYALTQKSTQTSINQFIDNEGWLAVRFHGGLRTYETYTYDAIVQSLLDIEAGKKPLLDPALFKDSWVFFGVDAPGLLDLRPTPLSERYAGVELNATILDNLIHGTFAKKIPPLTSILLTAILVGILVAALLFFFNPLAILAFFALCIGGLLYGSVYFAELGVWAPVVWPILSLSLAGLLSLLTQYQLVGRQHRFLRGAFKHYVSEAVIDKIVADPSALSLGGEKRELTLFFSDIVGFTSLSESIEPTKLVSLLNRFLTEMTKIIMMHNGTVDKYVGDAIVAFWNAPLAVADHAALGVKTALLCQKKLEDLAAEFQKDFGVTLKMRIGINTGVVSVGNFGSEEQFNYTVIGDAANLASRLEGASKYFGTSTIVSETTMEQAKSKFIFRRIGSVRVAGKGTPVSVYEPLSVPLHTGKPKQIQDFERAVSLFEQGLFDEARDIFRALTEDPVAGAYLQRITKELNSTRGGDWDPIWNLTEK